MANPKLRLRNMMAEAKPVIAVFMALKGMRAAQVIAHTGFDAVIIDREHGNIDDSDMHEMVSAVASAGASPIVRVRGPTGPLIKRALDTGAHGLLVPMIDTAEQARAVVSMARFPPLGVRGQGSAFTCFEHGLATPAEYVAQANANLVNMIQIESKSGLANVDAICQVEGIDLVFIGPNDLALSLLGYTPASTEPVFLEAIDLIVEAAKRNGKKVGILVANGQQAKEASARFDFVAMGTDVRALQAFFSTELSVARS